MDISQYRTAYHFQPPKNWINDPNGPMYYNGFYHFFYQYNPHGPLWGNISWGHSVSRDLINWSVLDPAITPGQPFDVDGCWSGSTTILSDGRPVILYTGRHQDKRQVQNIAFPTNDILSDPMLREWSKPDYNPVIVPVEGFDPKEFRDPSTGWLGEDGYWRVVVGSIADRVGLALLYKSKDFIHWTKAQQPLRSVEDFGMLECPDFFPVSLNGREEGLKDASVKDVGDVKHVLKVSNFDKGIDVYTVGTYLPDDGDVYVPDEGFDEGPTGLRYDYGKFYASKSFFDSKQKRRISWGWSHELDKDGIVARGWAGVQTIPRVVWLHESGEQLMQWPVKELESLRGEKISMQDVELKPRCTIEVKGLLDAAQADVEVEFHIPSLEKVEALDSCWQQLEDPEDLYRLKKVDGPGGVGPFGLHVLASENLEEHTSVFFRVFKARDKYVTLMCSDLTRSSLKEKITKPAYGGFVNIDVANTLKISLRTLIDHSVVESFGAEGRTCITSRVYPTSLLTGKTHLHLFNNGTETISVSSLKAWEMAKAEIS